MTDAMIEVTGLAKTYATGAVLVQALRGVDLSVKKGSMVAIMGPSGCGKTTLLNCISGIDDPTEGRILIESTDLAALDDDSKTSYRGGGHRGPLATAVGPQHAIPGERDLVLWPHSVGVKTRWGRRCSDVIAR